MAEMNKDEMEKAQKLAEDKMRTIDMQVDTVDVERANNTLGYYYSGNNPAPWGNTITVNYIPDNDEWNNMSEDKTTLIHEQKHRDNYLQGIHAYAVSPEQAYKRNMHDEISANMTELIYLRQRYIETGDISVFDESSKFNFYKEAIKRGEINPNSQKKEDFDRDMRLIVNGTQKMWMGTFATSDAYLNSGLGKMSNYGDYEGKYAKYWDENYKNSLKIAYNIGGVDFTKYMDKDVEIPHEADVKMVKEITDNPAMQKYYHLTDEQVFEKSGLSPYDGSISLAEYKKLLQHQMALNNFVGSISDIHEDGSVTKYTTQEYLTKLNSKETIEKYKKMYEEYTSPDISNADEVKERFPTFESFLKFEQSMDADGYKEKLDNAINNESFIDKMVEYQAQEYAKTGKDFPQDNPENYHKALNKLYCGAYDIFKPDETKLKSELSKTAKELQNKSAWEHTMENYLKTVGFSSEYAEYKAHNLAQKNKIIGGWACFVGGPIAGAFNKAKDLKHSLTHIKNEKGEEQNVGLWGKIKYKVNDWLKPGKGKLISTAEVENKPIHPVNKQKPEYREWKNEDGSRVSPVQYRKIPDMNKSIINQPTNSNTNKQQDNNSSKTAIASKMKNDKAKAEVAGARSKNRNVANRDKTELRNVMRKDAVNARNVSQNIGKQRATTKKVSQIGRSEPSQSQVLKDLYHKVFGR